MAPLTRLLAAAGAALLGLLAAAVLLAAPAQAHAKLIATAPAAGATVPTAPGDVQLIFDGNVISLGLQFQVIGPSGLASQGKPVVDRRTVTQPLADPLVNGSYLVNWHVVHDDGHPDSGTFSFAVQVAGGPVANGSPVTVSPASFVDSESDQPGLPPFWAGLGLAIVTVTVVIAVVIDRRRRTSTPS